MTGMIAVEAGTNVQCGIVFDAGTRRTWFWTGVDGEKRMIRVTAKMEGWEMCCTVTLGLKGRWWC